MRDFNKKKIIITGTSKGIGRALAQYFASLGADVVAVSRKEDSFEEKNITTIKADISETDKIISLSGTPDILINNAGVMLYKKLMDIDRSDLENVFDVNVFSTMMLSQAVASKMIKKNIKGVIVNTISFAAIIPSVGSGVYAASKAALASFNRTMAAELAPYGIRVNGYSPGVIETEMTLPAIEKNRKKMINDIAQRTIGSTSQILETVAFLASDESSYITGVNLEVTGGKFITQNSYMAWVEEGVD